VKARPVQPVSDAPGISAKCRAHRLGHREAGQAVHPHGSGRRRRRPATAPRPPVVAPNSPPKSRICSASLVRPPWAGARSTASCTPDHATTASIAVDQFPPLRLHRSQSCWTTSHTDRCHDPHRARPPVRLEQARFAAFRIRTRPASIDPIGSRRGRGAPAGPHVRGSARSSAEQPEMHSPPQPERRQVAGPPRWRSRHTRMPRGRTFFIRRPDPATVVPICSRRSRGDPNNW